MFSRNKSLSLFFFFYIVPHLTKFNILKTSSWSKVYYKYCSPIHIHRDSNLKVPLVITLKYQLTLVSILI